MQKLPDPNRDELELAYVAGFSESEPAERLSLTSATGHGPAAPARGRERWSWWPRVSLVAVPALGIAVLALGLWNISLHNRLSDRDVAAVTPVGKVGSVVAFRSGDVRLYGSLPPAASGH